MDRMAQFYRDTLGFHIGWNGGDFTEFESASGAPHLFMYSRKLFVQAFGYVIPNGLNQTFEVAFWLPCYADVDAEYERLSRLDAQFPSGKPVPYDWGIHNFYIADPDGICSK